MRIAIAKDEAFSFTYQANIDALYAIGEVEFFSPMNDDVLPECDLLYLPGGYPELYMDALVGNSTMRELIREYAENGGRIFAECGGFMYLSADIDNKPMCGVLDLSATMENAKLNLGYRCLESDELTIRGHEFHYSEIKPGHINLKAKEHICQTTARGEKARTAIYRYKNVVAGYTHWYWAECGFEEMWNLMIKLK